MIRGVNVTAVPRALYVTLVASLLVTLGLGALLVRSGSPLQPVRRTAFELESPSTPWTAAH